MMADDLRGLARSQEEAPVAEELAIAQGEGILGMDVSEVYYYLNPGWNGNWELPKVPSFRLPASLLG